MADKPKKREGPQKPKNNWRGWKIYFDDDTEEWLRNKAREEGYKTPQERVRDKVRQEKLRDKK